MPNTRYLASLVVLTLTLHLSGCGALSAQNPGGQYGPVNAAAVGQSQRVMLFGADVVAYFTEGRYVQGTPQHSSTWEGVEFHFSSAQSKALFDAAPQRYLPQYGGYCANGIMFGIPWGGNASDFSLIDGKLYIFGGDTSKAAFELQQAENIRLADHYWASEIKGRNSFLQRAHRLVLRVPHYKTGAQQAEEVRAARAAKPSVPSR
jgi:YHS domain-containing protein